MPSFRSRKLPHSPEVTHYSSEAPRFRSERIFLPSKLVLYLGFLPREERHRFQLLRDIDAAITRRMKQADHAEKGRQLNHFLRHGFGTAYN